MLQLHLKNSRKIPAAYLVELGLVYFAATRSGQALKMWRRALKTNSDNDDILVSILLNNDLSGTSPIRSCTKQSNCCAAIRKPRAVLCGALRSACFHRQKNGGGYEFTNYGAYIKLKLLTTTTK